MTNNSQQKNNSKKNQHKAKGTYEQINNSNDTIDLIIPDNINTQIFISDIHGQNDIFIFSNWIDCIISYKNSNFMTQYYDFSNNKTRFEKN